MGFVIDTGIMRLTTNTFRTGCWSEVMAAPSTEEKESKEENEKGGPREKGKTRECEKSLEHLFPLKG